MFPPTPQGADLGLQSMAGGLTPDLDTMAAGLPEPPNPYDEKRLLDLFDKLKKECFDNRYIFERDWQKENLYVANRQWITYHPSRREWVDKRLQKWIPRPITNKMAETVQSIRTNLCAINLEVKCQPVSNEPANIAAAAIADQMAPAIHEEHDMNQVMREADYWMIVNGSVLLQISWDTDARFNRTFIKHEQCSQCGATYAPKDIVANNNMCPDCGSTQFQDAIDPETGQVAGEWIAFGRGKTVALSPFEWAVPQSVTRFDEVPYIIRLRWREKHWFEANMPEIVSKISWEKSTTDRSLQIFKALAGNSDSGNSQGYTFGASANTNTEGVTEYELWMKPTPDFPEGLVMRVVGEKNPVLLQIEKESIPGPFPYRDIEGKPLFPFSFAQYEHMGGKLYGRSALAPLLQKQDQLNQLDSLIQLIVQRMANPIWIVPEGAGIEHFTGEPGLVMKYNALGAGGNAKPEKVEGSEVPASLQMLRAEIIKDIEELSGAFDIIKGQKPTGIEAFSALQLLVERSQSRFTAVFQARGEMYRKWYQLAIELERQFGPEQRVWSVVGPNRGYTFRHFENAQLQGSITVKIEDGSNTPKTFLGKRAAIEQASQLMLLDPTDPDQRYALLEVFGLSDLVPTLNYHVQAALEMQDAFERWVQSPMGPSPLIVKPWHDAQIHWTERIKWLNGDKMRELMTMNPMIEGLITQHLGELQMVLMGGMADQQMREAGGPPGGGGMAMQNSNKNGGNPKENKGTSQQAVDHGPA